MVSMEVKTLRQYIEHLVGTKSAVAGGDVDAETGGGRRKLLGGRGGELGLGEVEDGVVRLRDVADGDGVPDDTRHGEL